MVSSGPIFVYYSRIFQNNCSDPSTLNVYERCECISDVYMSVRSDVYLAWVAFDGALNGLKVNFICFMFVLFANDTLENIQKTFRKKYLEYKHSDMY